MLYLYNGVVNANRKVQVTDTHQCNNTSQHNAPDAQCTMLHSTMLPAQCTTMHNAPGVRV